MKIIKTLLLFYCLNTIYTLIGMHHKVVVAMPGRVYTRRDLIASIPFMCDREYKRYPKLFHALQYYFDDPELHYALALRYANNPIDVSLEAWDQAMASLYATDGDQLTLINANLTFTELEKIILSLPPIIALKITTLNIAKNPLTELPLAIFNLPQLQTVMLDHKVKISSFLRSQKIVFKKIAP